MSNILITGSSNGLGKLLAEALDKQGHNILCYDLENSMDVRKPHDSLIVSCAKFGGVDILINNAGVNSLDWFINFEESEWDRVFDTNVKGIFKMTQATLPLLIGSKGTILNISSDAAWRPMRCSTAYCSSKAAVEMMTKQLARELTKEHGITVFGISPNKLAGTNMSKYVDDIVPEIRGWSKEYAKEYQLSALVTGEETDPNQLVEFICFLLQDKDHHKYLSGCIIPYGA